MQERTREPVPFDDSSNSNNHHADDDEDEAADAGDGDAEDDPHPPCSRPRVERRFCSGKDSCP